MPNNNITMLWLWNGLLWLVALTPQLRYYFENCGAYQGLSLDGRSSHCLCLLSAALWTATAIHLSELRWSVLPSLIMMSWNLSETGSLIKFPALKSSWHVFWSQQWKVANTDIKSTCCFGFGLVFERVSYYSLSLNLPNWETISSWYFKQNEV